MEEQLNLKFFELGPEDQEFIRSRCTPENFYELLKALTFYADADNYFAVMVYGDRPCGAFAEDISEVHFIDDDSGNEVDSKIVPGKLARDTIGLLFPEDEKI